MAKISTIRCRLWSKSKTQLAKKYGLWNMKWTAKMYFRDHVLIMLVLTKAKCYKPRNSNMSESAFFEQQIACVSYFALPSNFLEHSRLSLLLLPPVALFFVTTTRKHHSSLYFHYCYFPHWIFSQMPLRTF